MEDPGRGPSEITGAALALSVDHSTAEVLRAFEGEGVSSLVLKGPALARWLYGPGERRHYGDVDLLVAPPHWETAQRVLAELGFVARGELGPGPTPWWNAHALEWTHPAYYAVVDLHYTLQGVGVGARALVVEPLEPHGDTRRRGLPGHRPDDPRAGADAGASRLPEWWWIPGGRAGTRAGAVG